MIGPRTEIAGKGETKDRRGVCERHCALALMTVSRLYAGCDGGMRALAGYDR
jgi:hypothetical protein